MTLVLRCKLECVFPLRCGPVIARCAPCLCGAATRLTSPCVCLTVKCESEPTSRKARVRARPLPASDSAAASPPRHCNWAVQNYNRGTKWGSCGGQHACATEGPHLQAGRQDR